MSYIISLFDLEIMPRGPRGILIKSILLQGPMYISFQGVSNTYCLSKL